MKVIYTACLLIGALFSAAMAESVDETSSSTTENAGTAQSSASQAESAGATPQPKASSAKSNEQFRPSEKISADTAVSFPADI